MLSDQRLNLNGEYLRNDSVVADLPFQPFIQPDDPFLLLETFVAVDDNADGFRCTFLLQHR